MTFILNCATSEHVFQVSDRKLTYFPSGKPYDEESNKAVMVNGRMAFAYTGLGKIGRVSTDEWLVKTIATVTEDNLGAIAEKIRQQATTDFARLNARDRNILKHAFVGVGWTIYNSETELSPILLTIDNALDASGEWSTVTSQEFKTTLNSWGISKNFCIGSAGVSISQLEKKAVWRHLTRIVKHGELPLAMLRGMINACLWIADRHKPWVGKSLMALCIPKKAVLKTMNTSRVMMFSSASKETAYFFYISKDGKQGINFGPHFVNRGNAYTNYRIENLDNPDK